MNKFLLTFIGISIAVLSCKKEKEDVIPTPQQYLSGGWRITDVAYDNNYNKVQDSNEKYKPLYLMDYTFYPDGIGTIHQSHPDNPADNYHQTFAWSFRDDYKEIEMNLKHEIKPEKNIAKIKQLDGDHMVLEIRDTVFSLEYIEWIFFEKRQ